MKRWFSEFGLLTFVCALGLILGVGFIVVFSTPTPVKADAYGYILMPDFQCSDAGWGRISYVSGFKNGKPVCSTLEIQGGPSLTTSEYDDEKGHHTVVIQLQPPSSNSTSGKDSSIMQVTPGSVTTK